MSVCKRQETREGTSSKQWGHHHHPRSSSLLPRPPQRAWHAGGGHPQRACRSATDRFPSLRPSSQSPAGARPRAPQSDVAIPTAQSGPMPVPALAGWQWSCEPRHTRPVLAWRLGGDRRRCVPFCVHPALPGTAKRLPFMFHPLKSLSTTSTFAPCRRARPHTPSGRGPPHPARPLPCLT